MNRNSLSLLSLLVGALSLAACSGPPGGFGGGGGGTPGSANVTITLVTDTPPVIPSIVAYTVSVDEITLTPVSGGTAVTLTPANPVIDLMRLQSDSAFLGTVTDVPAGSYTVTVALSGEQITFLNTSGSAITVGTTACADGDLCAVSLNSSGSPAVSAFTFTANSAANQGLGLDLNLNATLALAGGTLTASFPASSVTAFTLPRANSNLAANQLDLIEDFTGVVSSTQANTVTITSATRGTLTATTTAITGFDPDPSGSLCANATTLADCVSSNQVASMDAVLNADGTLSVLEIEPLSDSVEDLVEGTVIALNPANSTEFGIVVSDKLPAATGSLISGLNVGDPLMVNIDTLNISPFFVDTKGLDIVDVSPTALDSFQGHTDTTAIFPGQTVAVHVTALTASSGTTPASATVDTVTLRWSRFTAQVAPLSSSSFNVATLPSFFDFTPSSTFQVQAFTTGTRNTRVDGLADLANLNPAKPIALRALFFENPSLSLTPAFFAAKVRQQ